MPFDPNIDAAREPPRGAAVTAGVDRQDDTLGFWVEARSPRVLEDTLAVSLGGGVGWFPGLPRARAEEDAASGPWSPFGHVRLRADYGLRIAESPHRLFVALGPSVVFPSAERSSTRAGVGVHGGLGVELFAGDRFRTYPLALVVELGAAAHLAEADVGLQETENAPPLATGFALSAGLRFYPFD
jgi:hypothetical protein